jgi:diphosphomevalonate decarboxylase
MQQTVKNSSLYRQWPKKVAQDLQMLKQALSTQDFTLLGKTAESNALAMHATMLSSWPPICYFFPETIAAMHEIWMLRQEGLDIYFTEDAGPNLKLLFQHKDEKHIRNFFPDVEVIKVFG